MSTIAIRQFATVDASHTIHIILPPEMTDRVEVIVIPAPENKNAIPEESLLQARVMDESGFARNVLDNPEEDCWNDI